MFFCRHMIHWMVLSSWDDVFLLKLHSKIFLARGVNIQRKIGVLLVTGCLVVTGLDTSLKDDEVTCYFLSDRLDNYLFSLCRYCTWFPDIADYFRSNYNTALFASLHISSICLAALPRHFY